MPFLWFKGKEITPSPIRAPRELTIDLMDDTLRQRFLERMAHNTCACGFVQADRDEYIWFANRAMSVMFGYGYDESDCHSELVGLNIHDLLPKASRMPHSRAYKAHLDIPIAATGFLPAVTGLRKDKSEIQVQIFPGETRIVGGEPLACSLILEVKKGGLAIGGSTSQTG